jgi:hypothetical protein
MALPELVRDCENGFLFRPGDPAALADRIVTLLSDPDRAARMGRACRAIAERHRMNGTLAAFESLYESVLAKAAIRRLAPGTPWRLSSESWQIAGNTLPAKKSWRF